MDFDLHGRPPFVPPPLLDLVDWPPCPLELDLHQQGYFTSRAALHWRSHYGLEATFSFSLSLFPGYQGSEAFPRRRPLHGLSYLWVSGSGAVVTLLLSHSTLATPC